MKKILSLTLALLLVVGMFAACSSKPADSTTPEASGTTAEADTPTDSNDTAETEEPVEIVWYVKGAEPNHYEEVMAAFNEKALADINMTLDLRFISDGDYNTKMQMAMAGGDDWDLCFTAHWSNNYAAAAGKGAYLELTPEMLQEYAPDVMATIPEFMWDGLKISGKLYGLLNYQVMYTEPGFMFNSEAVEGSGLDLSTITDYDSLLEAFKLLAETYPDKFATRGFGPSTPYAMFRDAEMSMVMAYPWLGFNPDTQKIEPNYFFDDAITIEFFEIAQACRELGLQPADAATLKDENTLINGGQMLSRYNAMKPGTEADLKAARGIDFDVISMGPRTVTTTQVQSTITAVNVNSQHPEKASQMYNYVFSNAEAANILFWGLEGQDYELVDGRVQQLPDCWVASQWQLGNQFNAMLTVNNEEGVWEETMENNAAAQPDVLFGFIPNRDPIETELATCEAIWTEYKDILYYGLKDYTEVVPEMMEKMQLAGLDKVVAELQTQVDAFLAAK